MRRELPVYLAEILQQCEDIRVFADGLSFEDYLERKQVRRAVERAFIILGEALVCSARLTSDIHAALPNARNVIAFSQHFGPQLLGRERGACLDYRSATCAVVVEGSRAVAGEA